MGIKKICMIRKLFLYGLLGVALMTGVSCDGNKKGSNLGKSISTANELLVVCNKDWLKSSQAEAFRQIVNADMPCLPQQESYFRLTNINPAAFKDRFRFYALIVQAEFGKEHPKAEVQVARNVYCQPQLVVKLVAPDEAAFTQLCEEHRDEVLRMLNEEETKRNVKLLQRTYSGLVQSQAKKQFGCDVHAPEEINAIKEGTDFFWASSEGDHDNYLNFCMYAYPYDSAQSLTEEAVIAKRDSIMRLNILGETMPDGQVPYMTTDHNVLQSTVQKVGSRNVLEIRGLWAMEHEAMGGPFVLQAQYDSIHQRVLVAEGFVFAPNKKKREYVRQLEAALQTLTFL